MIKHNLILGDCLQEMKKMEDGSVDVVFTSPPYNDSGTSEKDKENLRHFKYENAEYREDWFDWQCQCIDEMRRVAKRQVLYNVQPILSNKTDVYKLIGKYSDAIDNILIWYKPNAQPQHYPHRIANFYEMVLVIKCSDFDKLYINSNGYSNVIVKNINSNRTYSKIHREIMSEGFSDEIIREFTKDGDIVLDPFMGLGTTGLSCIKANRDFVGIEIYKPYFEIAKDRISNANAQVTLFETGSFFEQNCLAIGELDENT